jgi:hypothetical protein
VEHCADFFAVVIHSCDREKSWVKILMQMPSTNPTGHSACDHAAEHGARSGDKKPVWACLH